MKTENTTTCIMYTTTQPKCCDVVMMQICPHLQSLWYNYYYKGRQGSGFVHSVADTSKLGSSRFNLVNVVTLLWMFASLSLQLGTLWQSPRNSIQCWDALLLIIQPTMN